MNNQEREFHSTYCSIKVAAKILGIHPESVRRLCRQGKMECIHVGAKIIFSHRYLADFAQRYDANTGNIV